MIALVLIFVGMALLPDIIVPFLPFDFVNFIIAMPLADILHITYAQAIMATFAFGGLLVILGFLIFPYNTKRLLSSKVKKMTIFVLRHPFLVIAAILLVFIMFMFFQYIYDTIWQYAKDFVLQQMGG